MLQASFPTHGACAVFKALEVDQLPWATAVGPAAFASLMLRHAPIKIFGEADVQPVIGVAKDIDKVQGGLPLGLALAPRAGLEPTT